MPADLLVDLGPQTQRAGHGRGGGRGIGVWVPTDEIRPDSRQFASAEVLPVGDGLGHRFAIPRVGVGEATPLLRDGRQLGGHRQGIQARHTEDARAHAQLRLGREQRLEASVVAARGGRTDDVADGLRRIFALGYPHHHRDRAGLVGDGIQAAGERALTAGLAAGSQHVGEQYGLVQR